MKYTFFLVVGESFFALNVCYWIVGLTAGAYLFYPPAGGNDIMSGEFSIDLVLTFANMVKVSYSILGRVG